MPRQNPFNIKEVIEEKLTWSDVFWFEISCVLHPKSHVVSPPSSTGPYNVAWRVVGVVHTLSLHPWWYYIPVPFEPFGCSYWLSPSLKSWGDWSCTLGSIVVLLLFSIYYVFYTWCVYRGVSTKEFPVSGFHSARSINTHNQWEHLALSIITRGVQNARTTDTGQIGVPHKTVVIVVVRVEVGASQIQLCLPASPILHRC